MDQVNNILSGAGKTSSYVLKNRYVSEGINFASNISGLGKIASAFMPAKENSNALAMKELAREAERIRMKKLAGDQYGVSGTFDNEMTERKVSTWSDIPDENAELQSQLLSDLSE